MSNFMRGGTGRGGEVDVNLPPAKYFRVVGEMLIDYSFT